MISISLVVLVAGVGAAHVVPHGFPHALEVAVTMAAQASVIGH